MAVSDAHVFPGFLTTLLTQFFVPKPPTTFLTCLCRGERRKYAGKRGSISQPPGHESDTLTSEPPGWGMTNITFENKVEKIGKEKNNNSNDDDNNNNNNNNNKQPLFEQHLTCFLRMLFFFW